MGASSVSLPVPVVVLCFLLVVSSSNAACFDDCIKSFTKGSSPSAEAIAQVVDCTTKCALGESEKLMEKCKYNLCYRACRALGGSKEFCSKKCHCSQLTFSTNDRDQEMMEELISLDNKLPKCKYNPCYRACHALGGSKNFCAKKCNCRQLTSLINNDHDLLEELISLDDKLMAPCKYSLCYRVCRATGGSKEFCAKKCHCSLPPPFTDDRDQEMIDELTSLDNKLPKCKYNPCYRACRALGGSKDFCAKKCNCRQLTSLINNDHDLLEELISLDDKLITPCKYSLCYQACRAAGGSKEFCAKKCHCTLPTSSTNDCDHEMAEELINLDEKLMEKCKYNLCYRACRALDGSKESCSKKCHCSLHTFSPFEFNQTVKMTEEEADDEAASAASA